MDVMFMTNLYKNITIQKISTRWILLPISSWITKGYKIALLSHDCTIRRIVASQHATVLLPSPNIKTMLTATQNL